MLRFVKLCTNFGETTPWFGKAVSGPIILRKADRGQEVVGIYGTLDEVSDLFFVPKLESFASKPHLRARPCTTPQNQSF